MAGQNRQKYVLYAGIIIALAIISLGGLSALGLVGGTASVSVTSTVTVTMPVNSINLGQLAVGATNSTLNGVPPPFTVQNDGNVKVNLTINATDLWTVTGNPTSNYQFLGNASSEGVCWGNATSGAVITWTNMYDIGTPTKFMPLLNYTDSCDLAEVEIKVTVPNPEPAGAKSSAVVLTATETT